MSVIRVRRVLEETIPLIVFFATIELVSGGFLSSLSAEMKVLPGILIMIPPLLDMRGNIGSSFGARLSSALHMGVVRPGKITKDLKTNIYSSLILSVVMSSMIAVISWFSCTMTSVSCITAEMFLVISLITGISAGLILIVIAVVFSMYSFTKGIDPDDVVSPAIGAIGDITTVICLFITIKFVLGV